MSYGRRSKKSAFRYGRRSLVRNAWNTGRLITAAWKHRGRKGRSRSKSRSRSRPGRQVQVGTGGISASYAKTHKKLYPSTRAILKTAQLSVYKIVDTARIEWDAGSQVVNSFFIGSVGDVSGMFSNIGASATGQDTTRMVVKSMIHKITITNQSNANAVITLYNVGWRQDTYNGDFASPLLAWQTGIAREEESGDSPSELNVGSTPFESSDFCRVYKVLKVTKLYLDPGKSHVHTSRHMCNKMLNNGMTDGTTSQIVGFNRFTQGVMTVCQGMPINDGTTDTLIAYGSGAVDVIEERKYEQAYPQYGLKRYYYDNNQGAITTEKIMNDETNSGTTYAEV